MVIVSFHTSSLMVIKFTTCTGLPGDTAAKVLSVNNNENYLKGKPPIRALGIEPIPVSEVKAEERLTVTSK
jgi:hypothetical protein